MRSIFIQSLILPGRHIHIFVCIYMYKHLYVYVYIHTQIYVYTCINICTYICVCLYIWLYSLSTFIWYTCIIWGVVCIYLGVQVSCSLRKYSRGYSGLWSMVCVGAALLTPFNLAVCLCYSFFLIPIPLSS